MHHCRDWIPGTGSTARIIPMLLLVFVAAGCTNGTSRSEVVDELPLDRGTFHVAITEVQTPKDGEAHLADPNIAVVLVTRSLVQHGFTPAKDPTKARYVIEGKAESWYWRPLEFQWTNNQNVHMEHQFKGKFEGTVTDRQAPGGERTVAVSVPEGYYGRTEMHNAERDIRRKVGSDACHALLNSELLQVTEVTALLDALADEKETRTFNQIAGRLVEIGSQAVPYLLDALRDDREVKVTGKYPGLDLPDAEAIRYVHVADRALSGILGADSGLELESDEEYELRVIVGWTWAWEDLQGIPEAHRTYPEERATKAPANVGS